MTRFVLPFAAAAVFLASGCDLGSSLDDPGGLKTDSRALTDETVNAMLAGDDDYDKHLRKLGEAVGKDGGNQAAKVFLAAAGLMKILEEDLVKPNGQLRDMMTRAGIVVDSSGGLFGLTLGVEAHGQGLIKDTTPDLDELGNYLRDRVGPALDLMAKGLDSIPADFEYIVPAENGGKLLELVSPGKSHAIRFDYGDVQAAAGIARAAMALIDLFSVYDFDGLRPNDLDIGDDPNLDFLGVVTGYANLGNILRFNRLPAVRNGVRGAFESYERAMDHMKGEDEQRMAEGLLTLGRDTFDSQGERDEFLANEPTGRDWVRSLIDGMFTVGTQSITTDWNGETLPENERLGLDLSKFFDGIEARQLYLKTVTDPDNNTVLGVTDFSNLTSPMATVNGLLDRVGGQAPGAGDLQEFGYAVKCATLPRDTKQMDGSFGDWNTDKKMVAGPAQAAFGETRPPLGNVYAARDADALFVYIDEDLWRNVTTSADGARVSVEWQDGEASVTRTVGVTSEFGSRPSLTPTSGHGVGSGLEFRFPAEQGGWAALRIEAYADNSSYEFDSERGCIFLLFD